MKVKMVSFIGTRLTNEARSNFIKKARKTQGMDQSDVLRELIHAYIEDRITITPPTLKGIYNV